MSEWLSPAQQPIWMPVARRYMLGDRKRRYLRDWSDDVNMHPVYEMIMAGLATLIEPANKNAPIKMGTATARDPCLSR